jgi:hypothetical protein
MLSRFFHEAKSKTSTIINIETSINRKRYVRRSSRVVGGSNDARVETLQDLSPTRPGDLGRKTKTSGRGSPNAIPGETTDA